MDRRKWWNTNTLPPSPSIFSRAKIIQGATAHKPRFHLIHRWVCQIRQRMTTNLYAPHEPSFSGKSERSKLCSFKYFRIFRLTPRVVYKLRAHYRFYCTLASCDYRSILHHSTLPSLNIAPCWKSMNTGFNAYLRTRAYHQGTRRIWVHWIHLSNWHSR